MASPPQSATPVTPVHRTGTQAARNRLQALDYSLLQQCMHCGMCLPSCPTYVDTRRERHSPRGRIALMRAVADGEQPLNRAFADEMDDCLGCLACTSACPAGVTYARLIEEARAAAEEAGVRAGWSRRVLRFVLMKQLFVRPRWLHLAGRALRFWQTSGLQRRFRRWGGPRVLPARLRQLEPATPSIEAAFSDEQLAPAETPPHPRFRVALLTGCVQDLVFASVNRATADVLLENGCTVETPRLQGCCGSLHAHNGDLETARTLARRLIDLIPPERFDAIISNAAGCGSHLKHYHWLLSADPAYAARAAAWDSKVRDISEWLVEIGFRVPAAPATPPPAPTVVTYHDACHLCHGQGITRQPRTVLGALPGVELRECAASTDCCGSAGIYSITHPATATRLAERKWDHLKRTGATVVAVANPGCTLHLNTNPGRPAGVALVHPVVLLARAYAQERRSRS